MAHISASVYTSHVPAIGAALDLGKTHEPYWQKVFTGYEFSKQWMKDNRPDVIFLVFNDHATAFSLEMIPTFTANGITGHGQAPRTGSCAPHIRLSGTVRPWSTSIRLTMVRSKSCWITLCAMCAASAG